MTVNLVRAPKWKSPAHHTATRLKDMQALDLHMAGVTFERIAEQLGYANRGNAWRSVHRLLDRQEAEGADQLRAVEGARLDRLLVAIWPTAIKGDLKAQAECRRNRESYRRLFGLDAPVKIDARISDATDSAIAELAAQLGLETGPVQIPAE